MKNIKKNDGRNEENYRKEFEENLRRMEKTNINKDGDEINSSYYKNK